MWLGIVFVSFGLNCCRFVWWGWVRSVYLCFGRMGDDYFGLWLSCVVCEIDVVL